MNWNIYEDREGTFVGRGYPPTADYWSAVTDVQCLSPKCSGTVRWNEAGYTPGWRTCDQCGQHYCARGDAGRPILYLAFLDEEGHAGPHNELRGEKLIPYKVSHANVG